MNNNRISLSVPADFKFAKVVRLTAASIANAQGLTVVDVEDIRLVAEEGFVYAAETLGNTGVVDIEFILDTPRSLTISFALGNTFVQEDVEEPSSAYAAFILGAICDECEITDGDSPFLRLTKHAEGFNGEE